MSQNIHILGEVTTVKTGDAIQTVDAPKSFQLIGSTTSGTGAVSVDVQVSNNNVNWLLAGTISLTLSTTPTSDGFAVNTKWLYARGKVNSISGTGATVTLIMGT